MWRKTNFIWWTKQKTFAFLGTRIYYVVPQFKPNSHELSGLQLNAGWLHLICNETFRPVWHYLPCSNVFYFLTKRSPEVGAQFESIAADFDDVVQQSTQGSQWESRREENDITKLNEHLQVIFEGILDEEMWKLVIMLLCLQYYPACFLSLYLSYRSQRNRD